MIRLTSAFLLCLLAMSVTPAGAQQPGQPPELFTTGTVVSSTETTLVVRTDAGDLRLFTLTPNTQQPAQIQAGARVRVVQAAPTDAFGVAPAAVVREEGAPQTQAKPPAAGQGQAKASDQPGTTTGTVVSSSRTTLVVKSGDEDYKLFQLTSNTTKPAQVPMGATVRVIAGPAADNGVPSATSVRIEALPPQGLQPQPPATDEPIPASVTKLEKSIQRETSRYRLGIRTGVALDPELVVIGAQGQIGPFFSENAWFRPNIEFDFGQVTDLVGFNFDGIYRLPVTQREGRWTVFFGGGLSLNISKEGFDPENFRTNVPASEDVSFSDWGFDAGLNLLGGISMRNGAFVEIKTTVYSEPTLRFILGYTFSPIF